MNQGISFQLTQIADTPSAEVELKDPETGAPMGVFFLLAGPEHELRREQDFARQRKLRAHFSKTGRMQLADPAEEEQDNIAALVSATLGWRNVKDVSGAEVPWSSAAATALFNAPEVGWMRAQLLAAMNERERFIKRSATA